MITIDDWRDYFPPTDEGIRPDQEKMVNFILNRLAEGVPNVWGEGPTGLGKSFAAYTIAQYCAIEFGWKSRFLAPNLFLENQYLRDFARLGMLQLHSSKHYECPQEGACNLGRDAEFIRMTPQEIPVTGIVGVALDPSPIQKGSLIEQAPVQPSHWQMRCTELADCPYLAARSAFNTAAIGVTNLKYALTCARFEHDFIRSDLVFIDEAHSLGDQICSLYELRLNPGKIPPVRGNEIPWVREFYLPRVEQRLAAVAQEINARAARSMSDPQLPGLSRIAARLKTEAYNLSMLVRSDPGDWVATFTENELIFQLVWAKKMAPALLDFLAPRRVLMSATLMNPVLQAQWLGVAA